MSATNAKKSKLNVAMNSVKSNGMNLNDSMYITKELKELDQRKIRKTSNSKSKTKQMFSKPAPTVSAFEKQGEVMQPQIID
jgi:hypothetical protein